MKQTIDISQWNTISNWPKAAQNVEKMIIRCGYRGYGNGKIVADKKFRQHADGCQIHNIPFGIYFMSQAITTEEGREEAEYAVACAKEFGATLPIFFDSEDGDGTATTVRADKLSKRARTDIAKAFCARVEELGFRSGVYASESWFQDHLYYEELKKYLIWCAKYNSNSGSPGKKPKWPKVDIWQYTSRGSVAGITGNVDLNEWYADLAAAANSEQNATANPYEEPTTNIRLNNEGESVYWVQWELKRHGHNIKIDGIFGPLTGDVVEEFQTKKGLEPDRVVGKLTRAALKE